MISLNLVLFGERERDGLCSSADRWFTWSRAWGKAKSDTSARRTGALPIIAGRNSKAMAMWRARYAAD